MSCLAGLVALLLLVALPAVTAASDDAKPGASPAEVRKAITVFGRAYRSKGPAERVRAVRALGSLVDKKVAKRLLKCVRSEDDPNVLVAAFEALSLQRPSKSMIVPKLVAHLATQVSVERGRMAKSDCGLRVHPKTGDVDVDSPEGKARLAALRKRSGMLRTLLSTLVALEWPVAKRPLDLTPLLLDPSDEVVIAVLKRMGKTKGWSSLQAVLALYRMYPAESMWETGAVVDWSGTNASAKAKWLVVFGHPEKQRTRPKVVTAIRAMLEAVTGKAFDTPGALAAYLDTPEVKKRVAGR